MSETLFDMELEAMSTEELEAVLKDELSQATKDFDRIHKIIEILRERKKAKSRAAVPAVTQEEVDAALLIYQEAKPIPQERKKPLWRLRAAVAVAAMLCLVLIAVPVVYGSPFVQEMIAKWNDDYFWIETPGTPVEPPKDYVFQTDNPGLQQLYDAVTELGITAPVVPMWLPEEFDDVLLDKVLTEDEVKISALFHGEDKEMVFLIEKTENMGSERTKNEIEPEIWVLMEQKHFCVTNNNNITKVIWTNGGYEITAIGSIEKPLMYSIIKSIYFGKEVD